MGKKNGKEKKKVLLRVKVPREYAEKAKEIEQLWRECGETGDKMWEYLLINPVGVFAFSVYCREELMRARMSGKINDDNLAEWQEALDEVDNNLRTVGETVIDLQNEQTIEFQQRQMAK